MAITEILDSIQGQLPGIIAGGGAVWIGKEFVTWFRERNTRTRGARYLAISLAVRFEAYAIQCANQISTNYMYVEIPDDPKQRLLKLTWEAAESESEHWENLDHDLTERVFTFQNIVKQADGAIQYEWENGEGDKGVTAVVGRFNEEARITGIKAWQLACDLRSRYGIAPFKVYEIGWDFVDMLNEQVAQDKERHAKQVASYKK